VRILDDAGRNLKVKNKSELTQVRAVELMEAALLSACDGNKPVDRADDVMSKEPVPAAKPGRLFGCQQRSNLNRREWDAVDLKKPPSGRRRAWLPG
jgi:hypothetical protein